MLKMEMRFNGRKITSASHLEREFKRSIERRVEDSLKRATSAWTDPRLLHTRIATDLISWTEDGGKSWTKDGSTFVAAREGTWSRWKKRRSGWRSIFKS